MDSDKNNFDLTPLSGNFPLETDSSTEDNTIDDYQLMPDFVCKQLVDNYQLILDFDSKQLVDDCQLMPDFVSKQLVDNKDPEDRPLYTGSVTDSYSKNSSFLWDVSAYNGKLGKSEKENADLALSLALSASAAEVIPEPDEVYLSFIEAFYAKKFTLANNIYDNAIDEAKQLIDFDLEEIPWRVSCEYYYNNGKVQWLNSWIKIGWWNSEECELSPQFSKGEWSYDNTNNPAAINTKCFEAVVWSGKGKDMIHKLMRADARANVEFEFTNGFLIPIDVAFTQAKSPKNILDLTQVEVGHFDPREDHNLDILRTALKSITRIDGTKLDMFRGCAIGAAFIPESDPSVYTIEHTYDDNEMEDMELIEQDTNESSVED